METKVTNTLVRHKVDSSVYTQTTYTGQIRWCRKPLYDEPILQQQVVINTIENNVIAKQGVKWVDVPVEWIED
jgi:hypothetical protein